MGIFMSKKKEMPDRLMVFIWLLLSLSVFYSGHLYSNDDVSKIESAKNLLKHGSFEVSGYNGAWGIPVAGGKTYPHFSLGSILLMVPPVFAYETASAVAGRPLPLFVRSSMVSGMNLVYTALSGCLFFMLLLNLGTSKKEAFIFTNILIFCSEMLQYSHTGWSEPAAFLFAICGFVVLTGRQRTGNETSLTRWGVWSLCSVAASLIRIEYIAFFLFFLFVAVIQRSIRLKEIVVSLGIVSLVILIHGGFNYYRFGSFFDFGYIGRNTKEGSSLVVSGAKSITDLIGWYASSRYFINFYRMHLSFGRLHWFWVSPLLLVSPLAFYYRKQIPSIIIRIFFAGCLYMLILAGLGSNSWTWANRYMYPIFPFLLLPVFFFPLYKRNIRTLFITLTAAGGLIAVLSTLINYHYVQELLVQKHGYHDAMWIKTAHFFNAPFWLHAQLFPEQLYNTFLLSVRGNNLPPWDIVRTRCFDIWPVSICGAGINSFISFGLWLIILAITLFFGWRVIKPAFLSSNKY